MAFINFIVTGGGGDPEAEAKLSAMTQDFTSTIERTVSSLTIPSGTTTIGENAFASCSALTELTIPASVQSIEANAFAENRSLETINFEGTTPPTVEDGAFTQLPSGVTVNVPEGSEDAYSAVTEDIEDSTAFIVEYTDLSGNTTVWYSKYSSITYSDATNAQPTVPEAGWAKIETKGVKSVDDNAMLFEPATEYVFDENLKYWGCTPLRGNIYPSAAKPTKVTFKSTSYDYFDGRIAEACTGLSSITFYCAEAPLTNTEGTPITTADTAAVGELLVPNGAHNYGIYKERICGDDWIIKDLSGRTMGTVTLTTDNGTETYNYYGYPNNAAFANNSDILNAKIEGFNNSGNQLFQGCTNLSSVTIDGHIRLDGSVFSGCSNLSVINWLNETAPAVSGSGQFDGVASEGTLYVNSGSTSTWETFRDTYLSGWTVSTYSPVSEIFCPVQNADEIKDFPCRTMSGATAGTVTGEYDSEGNPVEMAIVSGNTFILSGLGEFTVTYDSATYDTIVIDNATGEPAEQPYNDYIEPMASEESDGNIYIMYNLQASHSLDSISCDDLTGWYWECE